MSQPLPFIAQPRPYWFTQPAHPVSHVSPAQVEEEVIDCIQPRYEFRNLPRRAFSSSLPQRSSAPITNSPSGLGRFDRSSSILDTEIFKYPIKQIPTSYLVIPPPTSPLTPISIPPFPITREDYEIAYVDPDVRKELAASSKEREENLKELEEGKVDFIDLEKWENDRKRAREAKRRSDRLRSQQVIVVHVDLTTVDEEEDDEREREVKRMRFDSIEILGSFPHQSPSEPGLSTESQVSAKLALESTFTSPVEVSSQFEPSIPGHDDSDLESEQDTVMKLDSDEASVLAPIPLLHPNSPAKAEAMDLDSHVEQKSVSSISQVESLSSLTPPDQAPQGPFDINIIVTSPTPSSASPSLMPLQLPPRDIVQGLITPSSAMDEVDPLEESAGNVKREEGEEDNCPGTIPEPAETEIERVEGETQKQLADPTTPEQQLIQFPTDEEYESPANSKSPQTDLSSSQSEFAQIGSAFDAVSSTLYETSIPPVLGPGDQIQPQQISTSESGNGIDRLEMFDWSWSRMGSRAPSFSDTELNVLDSDYDFASRTASQESSPAPISLVDDVQEQKPLLGSPTSLPTSIQPNDSTKSISQDKSESSIL